MLRVCPCVLVGGKVRVSNPGEAMSDRQSSQLQYFSVLIKAGETGDGHKGSPHSIQEVYATCCSLFGDVFVIVAVVIIVIIVVLVSVLSIGRYTYGLQK